ncbi:unnamed protein product (plasmid) [Mycetohabitans rhizoxinica HKI 454]|uniref:Uncharacterized protein n=1 Tax=Mycetohabitans rhizoxinica (strain DSM 19002 / CIP 109453 / HKI 454) TaxID=882378 RepID=E5AUW1_MYCRK|nr:unnamed protein product [Mycetohabitans rhizoxinica HKI 454]
MRDAVVLAVLDTTPNHAYQDDESPSRSFVRGWDFSSRCSCCHYIESLSSVVRF